MSIINGSKDLLNIAIALSIIGFTFFVCWLIFYSVMMLKQSFLIVREMRQRLLKIDEVIKAIKDKVESSVSYLLLISEGVKKLVEVIKSHTEKKKEKDEE